MERTILETIAEFCFSLDLKEVPSDVIRHAKVCVMDALECCLSSENDFRKEGAFNSFEKGCDRECTLFGTGERSDAPDAAFYNTVSGAIAYRNDISIVGKGHPGSIAIPTVLAVAEKYGCDGKTALEAIIIGYEVMIRFGAMLGDADFSYAFRPTAFVGPVGAAFAAAKVMGLSKEQTVSAASLAFNCASGLNQWADDGTGEDVIQNGWGAKNGVVCAEMAKAGVLGAPNVIEGKFGFGKAFGVTDSLSILTEKLGVEYYLKDTRFKQIPACMNVQNAAQIADYIAKQEGFDKNRVSSVLIEMTGGGKHWPNGDKKEVETLIHAAMSVPYTVAQTLIAGDCDKVLFAPPYSSETREMINRCEVVENPEFTRIQKQHQVIRVTVTQNDGRVFSEKRLDARTLTEEEAVDKFMATVDRIYGNGKGKEFKNQLVELESIGDVSSILSNLR